MPDTAAMTPPVPFVLRRDERRPVKAKVVLVALVVVRELALSIDEVAFVVLRLVAKRLDEVELVALLFVVNRLVEVAFVVVPLFTVSRSIVEEALTMIPTVVVGVSAPETTFQSRKAVPM